MIDAAKAYRARGWRPIRLNGLNPETGRCTCAEANKPNAEGGYPVHKSAGKHPAMGKGWESFPMPTEQEIDELWAGWRANHNIGIATGRESGFFALDVDPDNGGFDSLNRLQKDHGRLTPTVVQTTGSGGWHLLYRMPEDFEPTNRRGGLKEYPGLDIRGTGGQIVAAPSRTPKGEYAWQSQPDAEPEPAPDWLLDLLRPTPPTVPTPAPRAVVGDDVESQRLESYAQRVRDLEVGRLTAMKDAATPGGVDYRGEVWDEGVFSVACALLELANSPWTIYDAEAAYTDVWYNAPRDEGFTDEHVTAKIKSAISTVGSRGREYPQERPDSAAEVASWLTEPGVRVDPVLLKGQPAPEGVTVAKDDTPLGVPMREWNDLGNAMRIVDHFGKGLRWVHEAEQWAIFREGQWQLVKPQVVQGLVQRMFDELLPVTEASQYDDTPGGDEGDEESDRERFLKWVKAQKMSARISAASKEAQGRWELHASIEDFDAHPMLLNVANGVVDLASGDLQPHDPVLLLRSRCPVDYDSTAAAPLWQRFLDRVMPDPEMQSYLQRVLGYTITGSTREQAYFVWHGDGANGKSVVAAIVTKILGAYGGTVAPGVLLAGAQEQHPTGWAAMAGCRWLPATETAPGKRLEEEKIKEFTGGQPISARFMAKDFFDYLPVGKIHLITNHLPVLSGASSIWRRTHLIKWGVTIPLEEQDRFLEEKLQAELPGTLAWLVRGAQAWQEQGLNPPAPALADVAEWRGDSDSFGEFLLERTIPAPGGKTPTMSLYRAYTNWAFDQGIRKPMTQQSFVAAMLERKYERYRDARGRGFVGIVPVVQTVGLPWEESA